MPLIQKARTGTGYFVQTIGYLLWLGCGLYIMFYEIWVIYDAFGFWLAALAFLFFPIVYVFAFFIDWFITGIFPLGIFILWLVSWVGIAIVAAGASIREAQGMNWFRRHLNWTYVLSYLLWFVLSSGSEVAGLVAAVFWLIVSGWIIKQKGRRLWWLLLSWFLSPLWLKNKKSYRELTETEDLKRE